MAEQAGARVIRLSTNSGPATARNRAAQEASGEILLFTDSDVLIPKSALAQIRQVLFQTGADAIQGTFSLYVPTPIIFPNTKISITASYSTSCRTGSTPPSLPSPQSKEKPFCNAVASTRTSKALRWRTEHWAGILSIQAIKSIWTVHLK